VANCTTFGVRKVCAKLLGRGAYFTGTVALALSSIVSVRCQQCARCSFLAPSRKSFFLLNFRDYSQRRESVVRLAVHADSVRIDPKLVLLVTTSEPRRLRREFIKPACRNRVMHIAGSDRQKLCRANRNVKLFDWRFQIANVKAVGFDIDPFLYRNDEL